jgi:hypothetical protein
MQQRAQVAARLFVRGIGPEGEGQLLPRNGRVAMQEEVSQEGF